MKQDSRRPLELLAPAANKDVAIQAILHGADAIYIGASSHGARSKAANSVEDIADVVKCAHQYRAKVYVTVNTIVFEHELKQVERLVWQLYHIGVDAIIVQDMALLRLNLPPIALHASTQCDTRTPEKARFLEDVGFSQIVLARELTIDEIRRVCDAVTVPVECFIHGALCVSYSGRCAASGVTLGRSANRGECAQMCRMPYTLVNGRGEKILRDKYLLSLRDFNASASLKEMVDAGAGSFKIEGRLKDAAYVKNITAHYRGLLDEIIAENPEKYRRSSYGESEVTFAPDPCKSFNRGFTDYFLESRRPGRMASIDTPKSMGEEIVDVRMLNNGDGISFFNAEGVYEGVGVNRVEGNRIIGARPFQLPKGATIHRTLNRKWQQQLEGSTAERRILLDVTIDETGITGRDERGVEARISLECDISEARKPMDPRPVFAKLGNTIYRLRNFTNSLSAETFIPASQLTAARRRLIEALDKAALDTYHFDSRRKENPDALYPAESLDERDNVANSIARNFYEEHGVKNIRPAWETVPAADRKNVEVMTTRYCLRRELGCCLRDPKVSPQVRKKFEPPLTLITGPHSFRLEFDCQHCQMRLLK